MLSRREYDCLHQSSPTVRRRVCHHQRPTVPTTISAAVPREMYPDYLCFDATSYTINGFIPAATGPVSPQSRTTRTPHHGLDTHRIDHRQRHRPTSQKIETMTHPVEPINRGGIAIGKVSHETGPTTARSSPLMQNNSRAASTCAS